MMKVLFHRLLLPSLFLTTALSSAAHADDGELLATYLHNLGLYFGGYDLANQPPKDYGQAYNLINPSATQSPEESLVETMLGSIPVNATSSSTSAFVPNSNTTYSGLNNLANATFITPPYNSPSPQSVSANALIDQQPYQQDPVSQAVLNILGTPDYTYCTNNDNTMWLQGCAALNKSTPILYEAQVVNNVVGTIPSPFNYFTYDYNQTFLNQLNSNTLISPLLYSTSSNSAAPNSPGNSGPGNSTGSSSNGLAATSQAQQAANFIRYVTGAVAPIALPKLKDYNTVYTAAITPAADGTPTLKQIQAQATIGSYLASLRVYAAQTSVGIGNLYYIFSKRMPQNTVVTGASQTSSSVASKSSQALSEFTMATWRLFNPDQSSSSPSWLQQINQASPATVQKEMVTLLAEINYQLYLNRQQEERLLLTNSLLLLQNARASQPTASSLAPGNSDSTGQ